MKKSMSILTAILLAAILTAGAACAENTVDIPTAWDFQVRLEMPDGYRWEQADLGEGIPFTLILMTPENGSDPVLSLAVAYDEAYAGRSLGDLSPEETDAVFGGIDMEAPSVSRAVTSHGSPLIISDENSEFDEYVDISTLYQGYFVTLTLTPGTPARQITPQEIERAVEFLGTVWFITE